MGKSHRHAADSDGIQLNGTGSEWRYPVYGSVYLFSPGAPLFFWGGCEDEEERVFFAPSGN
jgi:hypothetical protein